MSDERSSGTSATAPGETNMNPGDEAPPGTPGTGEDVCPTCGGSGEIRLQQGFFAISRTCGQCRGEGKVITDRCTTCGAGGHEPQSLLRIVRRGLDRGQ